MFRRVLWLFVGLLSYGTQATVVPTRAASDESPAHQASPMPTGNGYGFAVYDVDHSSIQALHAKPFRFAESQVVTEQPIRRVHWSALRHSQFVEYWQESPMISDRSREGQAYYYMPFGLPHSALVTDWQGSPSCLEVRWASKIRSWELSTSSEPFIEVHLSASRVILVPLQSKSRLPVRATSCLAGASAWVLVPLSAGERPESVAQQVREWARTLNPQELRLREASEFEAWRTTQVPADLNPAELKLFRISETVLRMAQIRSPETSAQGMILASLPPGEWFIPWVRDMCYATVAFTQMGHGQEARQALEAMLKAGPIGELKRQARNRDYQISTVRYFGSGREEADRSGQMRPNFELDSWGLALWAFGVYYREFPDPLWLTLPTRRGSLYASLRDFVLAPLLGNLDSVKDGQVVTSDTSLWEQNELPYMHYAFSTLAAIAGIESFQALAQAANDLATLALGQRTALSLRRGLETGFTRNGHLHGTMEDSAKNNMDGALLEGFNLGALTSDQLQRDIHPRLPILHVKSGGYRRVSGATAYESQEFLFIDFALARNYLRLSQNRDAETIVALIVKKALNDHGLIPEMYLSQEREQYPGVFGQPTGAVPMVGYGAGAYLIYLYERAGGRKIVN